MTPLYIAFTMDGERIRAESPPGGPDTWELSEHALRGYAETLLVHGLPVTILPTPENAQRHASLHRELAAHGAEIGLHLHPESFLDGRYDRPLGAYDAGTQREILSKAADMVAQAVGARPTSFRSGNFSASDETFGLLADLGFTASSCSLPGRDIEHWAARWLGTNRYPHRAHAANRLIAGGLPIVEIPVTSDPVERTPSGDGRDLRIERGAFEVWHGPIVARTLDDIERSHPPVAGICVFTHNTFRYDDPDDPKRRTLEAFIAHIGTLASRYDVRVMTLGQLAAVVSG